MKVEFKNILLEDALKSIGCVVSDTSYRNAYYKLEGWFKIDNGKVILVPKDEVPDWVKKKLFGTSK